MKVDELYAWLKAKNFTNVVFMIFAILILCIGH